MGYRTLKEYMIKGFTMDDERPKNLGGGNYWKELLDRIRDICSFEKVMYRQVLEGAGTISHTQVMQKAMEEYRKYQTQNLSSVEEEYLESIKNIHKTAEKKGKN